MAPQGKERQPVFQSPEESTFVLFFKDSVVSRLQAWRTEA